jgi:hypothetical protein
LAGVNPEGARVAFVASMRRACGWLTDEPLLQIHDASTGDFVLNFRGRQATLESRNGYRLLWHVSHAYRVIPAAGEQRPWQILAVEYNYTLRLVGGADLIAYHWHPRGVSGITWPHAHFHTLTSPVDLSRTHFPTGRVALEAVVRYAIMELKVPVRTTRGQSRPRESAVLAQLASAIQAFEEVN